MRMTTFTGFLACLALTASACGSSGYTFTEADGDFAERPFELTAVQVADKSPVPYRDLGIPQGDNPRQIMRCYAPEDLFAGHPALCFEFVDGAMYYRSSEHLRFESEAMDDFESLYATGDERYGPGRSLLFEDGDKRCVVRTNDNGVLVPHEGGAILTAGSDNAEETYTSGKLCGRVQWYRSGRPTAAVTLRPSTAHEGMYNVIIYQYTPDLAVHTQRDAMLEATAP